MSLDILKERFNGKQIGRASCRERVQISGVAVSLKKKKKKKKDEQEKEEGDGVGTREERKR